MIRFFQYLSFQSRLSMVTDTFKEIGDDLVHILFVFLSVCFLIGVLCSLGYGAFDPDFQLLLPSFLESVESTLDLFKPAAVVQYILRFGNTSLTCSSGTECC